MHAHAIGPLAQLELRRTDDQGIIEVIIPSERYAQLAPRAGEDLLITPRRVEVFLESVH
jgi:sulfate transport system ATP-binding protein